MKIVLGSSSRWRKEVLTKMGFTNFITMSPDIDEKAIRDPDPRQLTLKIARAKAQALIPKLQQQDCILITSDQVVTWNGEIREKPTDPNQCREFLRSYRYHPAECVTAVCVYNTVTKQSFEGVDIAKQHFHPIPEDAIDGLIAQGDVMYCCGGFTIEHMEPFLKELEGEVETVTGLPKTLTFKLIEQAMSSVQQTSNQN